MHEFSSSLFISWAHDQREYELRHNYMKKVLHLDFSNSETRSIVIFGTISAAPLEAYRALRVLCQKGLVVGYSLHSCDIYYW
jgi:hypothetical protein